MVNAETDGAIGFTPSPENLAVIGGGRWARVLTQVLCGLVAPSVRISVHSPHNASSMSAWAVEQGLGQRLQVLSEWPQLHPGGSHAVIVANAARDHEGAIEWALAVGVPVLTEKPMALSGAAAQRLTAQARSRNGRFAAAHVFLFASYLDNFARLVAATGKPRFLRVRWVDPRLETRYGEQKQYDPGLPVFADCLPHVLAIAGVLAPDRRPRCAKLGFFQGGARLELELRLGDIPCNVQLARNGERRERVIEVATGDTSVQLDFSREPGTIVAGSDTRSADPHWEVQSRPLARMLTAFLGWARGGEYDPRLSVEIGVRACEVIDQAFAMYRSAQVSWLVERLAFPGPVDVDLHYALAEILQWKGSVAAATIEQQIERIRQQFCGSADPNRLRELTQAGDPAVFLKAIAG